MLSIPPSANARQPLPPLPPLLSAKATSQVSSNSTISSASSKDYKSIEKKLQKRIEEDSRNIVWEKNEQTYSIQISPFSAYICSRLYTSDQDDYLFLRDLLNHKAPTRQTRSGDLIWDFTAAEARLFLDKPRSEHFPKYVEFLYPQFWSLAKPYVFDSPDNSNTFFAVSEVFAQATCVKAVMRNEWFSIDITVPPSWETLAKDDPSQAIFEQLKKYRNESKSCSDKKFSSCLPYAELQEFMNCYYYYCQENRVPFATHPKPITAQFCHNNMEALEKRYNLDPFLFTLYQDHLAIISHDDRLDKIFASASELASRRFVGQAGNWVIPTENIQAFFKQILDTNLKAKTPELHPTGNVKQKPAVRDHLLNCIIKIHGSDKVELLRNKEGIKIFLSSDIPRFPIIERAIKEKIGCEIASLKPLDGYRKGLGIPQNDMLRFMELLTKLS